MRRTKIVITSDVFIGHSFYEIKSELINNITIQMICNLAKNKEKITL